MGITTDPNDPRLAKGNDTEPREQAEMYLALSAEELAKGYLRPVRNWYVHSVCNGQTRMPMACAQTHARDPWFYGGTYCCHCQKHRPLTEFKWVDGEPMAPQDWPEAVQQQVQELKAKQS